LVNISGNSFVEKSSFVLAVIKVTGIAVFAIGGLWVARQNVSNLIPSYGVSGHSVAEIVAALALSILAYKGFTTITNSGDEIKKPHKNVSRAIVISLTICTLVYLLVTLAVSANLSIEEIIKARDYSLAEAARPAFGEYGVWFTVGIAIIATVSGIIASIFAVSRMTAMLTGMKLIPHKHFGMPGNIQQHMLVYISVFAIVLTVAFDLSRIASLGAIFYLIMDIGIHWGVLTRLRQKVKPNIVIVITAIILDALALGAFLYVKATSDVLIVIVSLVMMVLIYTGEKWFLSIALK
jgi:amino acid transporter